MPFGFWSSSNSSQFLEPEVFWMCRVLLSLKMMVSTAMEVDETSGFRGFPSKHTRTVKSKKISFHTKKAAEV